jgi:phosphate transport system permease protein
MNPYRTISKDFFADKIDIRTLAGKSWLVLFLLETVIAIITLMLLMVNIIDSVFGYMIVVSKVDQVTLAVDGISIEEQSKEQLVGLLRANLSKGAFNKLEGEKSFDDRSRGEVLSVVEEKLLKYDVIETWNLWDSIFNRNVVNQKFVAVLTEEPNAQLKFVSWLTWQRVVRPQSSEALIAGIRTAILGSLWTIVITILFAFPIGVGAAIYLEEYAGKGWFNRVIQTNINNLAGVPSIVYGILGLAIFVRTLEPLTSGSLFGFVDPTTANGRTVLSAGLTLGLLVLPLIIINSQEAIRSVPQSLRHAGYGLGATKWQITWSHVLPNALPGILTGTILAVSRAIGETAPLVVVGASTAISFDPSSPFSKFTTLPIQIYQWTARPQAEWQHLAGAAILVLLVLLLSLNAIAIVMRNKLSRTY